MAVINRSRSIKPLYTIRSLKILEIPCSRRRRHARALDIADRMSTSSMVGGALQLARHHRAPALEERLTALQEGRLALEAQDAADAAAAAQQARLPAVPPAATHSRGRVQDHPAAGHASAGGARIPSPERLTARLRSLRPDSIANEPAALHARRPPQGLIQGCVPAQEAAGQHAWQNAGAPQEVRSPLRERPASPAQGRSPPAAAAAPKTATKCAPATLPASLSRFAVRIKTILLPVPHFLAGLLI